MPRSLALASVLLCALLVAPANAGRLHPACNVTMTCETLLGSPARAPGLEGKHAVARHRSHRVIDSAPATIVLHPQGCPRRLFCGCGAAVRIFGAPIRSLWLAANWFRFPRTAPAAGMVAVRRHHVF